MTALPSFKTSLALLVVVTGALAACQKNPASPGPTAAISPVPEALAAAMVPEPGQAPTDREIVRCQEKVRAGFQREAWIERLGWAFVAKARESFDPGYYKLAELCAQALEAATPGSPEGMLLRGHVLDSLHRFRDAEPLARRLVAGRGLSYDYALLGDVLMEQGRVEESIPAYQKAMDLRPDLHSYARASHVRWLTGDLPGAIELMKSAVGASSPLDPASVAWTCSRLASLDFQAGDNDSARQAVDAALAALPGYPPALLLKGRMALAAQDWRAAVPDLEAAAKSNPLPEPQWALAEALRGAGREADARAIEQQLRTRGELGDPRTLALYLATRGEDCALALRLAEQELRQRQDVFTHDALAWALLAADRLPEALAEMDKALAEGTEDGRLFFHAAVITARAGDLPAARGWIDRLDGLRQTLLPSERASLSRLASRLDAAGKTTLSGPESTTDGKTKPKTKS